MMLSSIDNNHIRNCNVCLQLKVELFTFLKTIPCSLYILDIFELSGKLNPIRCLAFLLEKLI